MEEENNKKEVIEVKAVNYQYALSKTQTKEILIVGK